MRRLTRLWLKVDDRFRVAREDGQGTTEYVLLVGLIAIFIIAAILLFRTQLQNFFSYITGKLGTR